MKNIIRRQPWVLSGNCSEFKMFKKVFNKPTNYFFFMLKHDVIKIDKICNPSTKWLNFVWLYVMWIIGMQCCSCKMCGRQNSKLHTKLKTLTARTFIVHVLFTARKRSLRRLCFYRWLSVHRGGMHGTWGACMAEGSLWWGACMAGGHAWWGGVHGRGHAWWGACVVGGMHGRGGMCGGGCAWRGTCMVGVCMAGGVHGWGACMAEGVGACHSRYYGIRSMSGRYASYWNAFLFELRLTFQKG